jgi:uncharacterized protein (DUF58 family)
MRVRARRIYIFPTRHGFVYGVVLLPMLVGSINYGSNLGMLFTFLLIGVGCVTILHTWRNLLDIELRVEQPPPVFAGDTARFTARLRENRGRERPAIRLAADGETQPPVDAAAVAPTHCDLSIPAPRRGALPLGRVRISTVYPLGLLRAWAYAQPEVEVLVYPRPAEATPMHSSPHYVNSDRGDRGVGADDFVGLRRDRPGDPPSHLDWKALARERGLVTRQFGGDRSERLWLDWETLPGLETEARLSRLCRMVLDAAGQEVRYGLRLPGCRIAPAAGEAHKHRCLAALARFGAAPE